MKWKNITLAKFQQVEAFNGSDIDEMDKVLHSVCVIYERTEYEINNEAPRKVARMIQKLQGVFESELVVAPVSRMGRYTILFDVSAITFGQYIELAFFIGSNGKDVVKNAHYILASMSNVWMRKYNSYNHKKKADYFINQPIAQVLGSVKNIVASFNQFNLQYKNLFGVDSEVSGKVQDEHFNKYYGWIYSATEVAKHEGVTLEVAYNLPVKQAFNALMFLKAKGKYEMEQFRKSRKSVQ